MKKNILITGGAGYIGSHIVWEIAKEGKYNIIILDNLENGNIKAIDIIKKNFNIDIKFYKLNLLNPEEIAVVFKENPIDIVIHMAAYIEAGISVVDPLRFFKNNVIGSINLFDQMQKSNVKKLIFSSTAALYPDDANEFKSEDDLVNGQSNAYAESKYMVERILKNLVSPIADSTKRIESVVLRYFNACGNSPELMIGQDYPRPTHLITLACQVALKKREKLVVFGNDYPTKDGTTCRDYIHVVDLAKAHIKAIDYLEGFKGNDIFNISTGIPTSTLEIVNYLEEVAGKFNWEFGPRRAGDNASVSANPQKAMEKLGWTPKYTFKDGVEHSYNWQKKYPNGYKDIAI